MESLSSKAFFSRSFDTRAEAYVEMVEQICSALSIETFCVNRGSSKNPSDEAKTLIKRADFLIALCTRHSKIEGVNEFTMSAAVREEMVIADTAGKPIICFVEDGVRKDGFIGSRLTYDVLGEVDRLSPHEINRLIKGIHDTKLQALRYAEMFPALSVLSNYFYENIKMQVELKELQKGLCWQYVMEKTLRFNADDEGPLAHSAWAPMASKDTEQPPIFSLDFVLNGRPVTPRLEQKANNNSISIKSYFEPPIKSGDSLFIRERYRSPYLNPIHLGQNSIAEIDLDGRTFQAYDGLCVVQRIESLLVSCVFPDWYEITQCKPIVGTFSNELDQLHQGEMNRIKQEGLFTTSSFDSKQSFSLAIERPLYQFLYGMTWMLPQERQLRTNIPTETVTWDDR